jgi:hypothetical protein
MELDRVQRTAQIVRDGRQHLFPNLIGLELSGDVAHDGKTDRNGGEIEPPGPDLHGNMHAVTTHELALSAPCSRVPESHDLRLRCVRAGEEVAQAQGEQGVQVVPKHPAGRRVRFDEVALRINNQNRVRYTFEKTPEPDLRFLGLETGGTLGVVQAGVIGR